MPKTPTETYDYGECDVCGTPMQAQCIKQDFWVRGELIVLDNVPAGVCPQCGAKVVNAEVGRHIAAVLGNAERIATAPRMAVPVIRLDAEPQVVTESS
jgi:YgiT-type zinc finger domain-containing protein